MDSIIRSIIVSDQEKYEKLSEILKYLFVNIAKISQDKYFILGSYAIREYRTINDLDINLDDQEFLKLERLTQKGFGHIEFYNGQIRWFYDLTSEYNALTNSTENDFSIEAFQKRPIDGYPNDQFSLGYLSQHQGLSVDNNGHQFFNLETLLKWKKMMNRPKDVSDIELITQILEQMGGKYRTNLLGYYGEGGSRNQRCQSYTAIGRQCKNIAKNGKYCFQHKK